MFYVCLYCLLLFCLMDVWVGMFYVCLCCLLLFCLMCGCVLCVFVFISFVSGWVDVTDMTLRANVAVAKNR